MTTAEELCISSPVAPVSRKRYWLQCAFVLSLIFHAFALLLVVYFSAFISAGQRSTNLIIQDIELSQQPSAPLQALAVPPEQNYVSTPPPPHVRESEQPAQEPLTDFKSVSTDKTAHAGGLTDTPLGLGMEHGYFSMLTDGKTLRDDVRAYYFDLVEKINQEWWKNAVLLKEPQRADGIFEILIQRDGSIVSLRLVRGSGSHEADLLIEDAIRKAAPMPALPTTYKMDQFNAPLRIKAPLSLFRIK